VNDPDAEDSVHADADQHMEDQERRENIRTIMRQVLSPIEHQIMTLYYQSDPPMTQSQIGDYLDMPINTVSSHIRRAKDKLRKPLQHLM